MWILCQDGENLLKISLVRLKGNTIMVWQEGDTSYGITAGEYKTEEEARYVYNNIVLAIKNQEQIFEMPAKGYIYERVCLECGKKYDIREEFPPDFTGSKNYCAVCNNIINLEDEDIFDGIEEEDENIEEILDVEDFIDDDIKIL